MLPHPYNCNSNWVTEMLDYLNLVTRSNVNVPNAVTIIGVRKALLIGNYVIYLLLIVSVRVAVKRSWWCRRYRGVWDSDYKNRNQVRRRGFSSSRCLVKGRFYCGTIFWRSKHLRQENKVHRNGGLRDSTSSLRTEHNFTFGLNKINHSWILMFYENNLKAGTGCI